MPRIRQNADKYAKDDMSREIRAQMARFTMPQRELAHKLNLSQSTVSKYIRDPDVMPMKVFRGMAEALNLDPMICMKFMKFSKSAIREVQQNDPG